MSRALAVITVFVAAFVVMVGILGVFAGIAAAFPTTEESFFKIGPTPEVKSAILAILGVVFVAVGLFLTRLAGKSFRTTS